MLYWLELIAIVLNFLFSSFFEYFKKFATKSKSKGRI